MSYGWVDVCDFNPWDEPSTYALLLLTGMFIWTLSIWIERRVTFRSAGRDTPRADLEKGLTELGSIAATATFVGGLAAIAILVESLTLLRYTNDFAWLASKLAECLIALNYGLFVGVLAGWSLRNLTSHLDHMQAGRFTDLRGRGRLRTGRGRFS